MSVIRTESRDNILFITIDRVAKKNSLTMDVVDEINAALDHADNERVIVFRGEGGFFSAGADVSQFRNISSEEAAFFSRKGNEMMDRIQNFDAVSLAALEGGAYGGGLELALSCDIRVASPTTKLGLTEINLGIFPGWGGLKRISVLAGKGPARYVALTGRVVTGTDAFSLGIVSVLADDPADYTLKLASELSQKSKESIRGIKKLLSRDVYQSDEESRLFGEVVVTREARELVEKFLKR
jgi:enoyl-CoA hydratase/carnithine racemase